MCGRFTLTVDPGQLQEAFPWVDIPDDFLRRYNIAPSQPVAVVPNDGNNKLDFFNWGLIPFWAKDPKQIRLLQLGLDPILGKGSQDRKSPDQCPRGDCR
jgi:putative SOS response-associated peptidase YedK